MNGRERKRKFTKLVRRQNFSFAPPGLWRFVPLLFPRLAPWAAFYRRFAAGLQRLSASPSASWSLPTQKRIKLRSMDSRGRLSPHKIFFFHDPLGEFQGYVFCWLRAGVG